jgi:hypothetical protein
LDTLVVDGLFTIAVLCFYWMWLRTIHWKPT